MKTSLILCVVTVLFVSGCANTSDVVKKEIVYVDKPLPFCPAPPLFPVVEFKVDLLTDADVKDPGKVGQAYKHDMLYLRELKKIQDMVMEQYRKTSQNFEAVQAEIKKLYETTATVDKTTSEVLKTDK